MSKHPFLVSDETVNSYGFKVITSGINTDKFKTNPVMLFMHERAKIIGRWENLKVENNQLFADAIFDTEDPVANEIAGKVERGFLKSASIGITNHNLENGVINSCDLFEISIVDIGSNSNALRLYNNTEQTMQLKLNEFLAVDSITSILGLSKELSTTEIVAQVKTLLQQKNNFENKVEQVELEREQEAKIYVDEAIKLKLIPLNYRDYQLQLFKENFNKARLELSELFPFQRLKLLDMLNLANDGKTTNNSDRTNWTLDDYRKFAPKELEKNPELFKELVELQMKR
jgi:HK97 family phage prohead protease